MREGYDVMNIRLIEPLGVSEELIAKLGKNLTEAGHDFKYYDTKTTEVEELISRSKDADILMIANNPLPNEVIDQLDRLKYISVAFAGIDHVGSSAEDRGISIKNTGGYSDDAVAELSLGLTLNLLRNIEEGNTVVRNSGTIKGLIGNELRGKTVGIVGTGRIGLRTAELYKAFKCNLIGYNRSIKDAGLNLGIEYMTLEEVMEKSDIVSLHIPLNNETKGLITKELINSMKKSSIMINVARGGVVDNNALAEALNNESIAGAGIDVFDMEPPIPKDYPLISAKNTVLTPHVAYATEESINRRASMAFDNVYGWVGL